MNDLEEMYRKGLSMVQNDINDLKSNEQHKEKQAKKYNDLKDKMQTRLTRLRQIMGIPVVEDKKKKIVQNKKKANLVELKPKYAYCVDGKLSNTI